MSVKHYPVDIHGALIDLGLREHVVTPPCCARLNTIPISWCQLIDRHHGPCHAEPMRAVESDDLGPAASKRRRF